MDVLNGWIGRRESPHPASGARYHHRGGHATQGRLLTFAAVLLNLEGGLT